MTVLILLIPILLQKAQNYMYLSSFYQQKTIKNFQNVLTKDLKDVDIGMNIKQKSEKKNDKWV